MKNNFFNIIFAAILAVLAAGNAHAKDLNLLTYPTTRPVSCIKNTTLRSPNTGKPKTGDNVNINQSHAGSGKTGARGVGRPGSRRGYPGARL